MTLPPSDAPGFVTTFYSYKGGVGRTFLLANVAWLLARWGRRVLCLDWDLEAPGLYRYLAPLASRGAGVIDILSSIDAGEPPSWRDGLAEIRVPSAGPGCLHLLDTGRGDDEYVRRVQALDWKGLSAKGLEQRLEELREEWVRPGSYHHVLVDSRTGITDIGGICAAQLPDLLVLTFTASFQSLEGALDVARRAERSREAMPLDRGGFNVLPVPSRLHVGEEDRLEAEWTDRFASALAHMMGPWKDRKTEVRQYLAQLSVREYARWSFGEHVPAKTEPLDDPKKASYTFANVAALVDQRLQDSGQVVTDRHDYVQRSARGSTLGTPDDTETPDGDFDVFVSYPSEAAEQALDFATTLEEDGVRTYLDRRNLPAGADWSRALYVARDRAPAFAILLNKNVASGRPQWDELRHIIRLAEERNVRIIPVLLDGEAYSVAPAHLTKYYGLDVRSEGGIKEVAHKVAKNVQRS